MTKVLKKLIAAALTLILLVLTLGISASAYENLPEGVCVSGVMITESGYWRYNRDLSLVKGSEYFYDVAYDAKTDTLTLKDTTVWHRRLIEFADYNFEITAAIVSMHDININLIGENEIIVDTSVTLRDESYGIYIVDGDAVISGEGSLSFTLRNQDDKYCIYNRDNEVEIKNTSISICKTENVTYSDIYGIYAYDVELENSSFTMDVADNNVAVGIGNTAENSAVRIKNSDVNINFKNFKEAYGFNIYETDIKNSNVNVNIDYAENRGYGVFSYIFKSEGSNVNCNLKNCNGRKNMSAIAYNNASINNDNMQQISTGSIMAKITPDSTRYSSIYINFAQSVFNPLEKIYLGYFKTENGSIVKGSASDWNVSYVQGLNRLYMDNAKLNQPMRAIGSADIILSGENVIDCPSTFAMYCDLNQKFYGEGSLTLISGTSCAIMCAEGVEFDDSVVVTASTSVDGSNPVEFKSEDAGYYKWIKIQPTEISPDTGDEPAEEPKEEGFFQKIINAIKDFFTKIGKFIIDIFD